MPSILLACNARRDEFSGMAGCMLRVGAELAGRGWQVEECFAPDEPRLPARLSRQLTYTRVAGAVRRLRPDVAVVASGDGLLVPLVAGRTRFVAESHGLEHHRREEVERHGLHVEHFGWGHRNVREPAVAVAARHARALVVKTQTQVAFAVERMGVRPERVHLIPNGIDDGFFAQPRATAAPPEVLVIGSWTEMKGSRLIPAVFEAVDRRLPDVRIHLVGTGVGPDEVLRSFRAWLRPQVLVTPHATRDDVQRACARADVGLQTSAYEGFGLALLEMLATGLPVVSTPVGVAPDVVTSSAIGALVPVHSGVEAFADALTRQLTRSSDPGAVDLRRQTASAYRWSEVGDRWDRLCRGLLADGGR